MKERYHLEMIEGNYFLGGNLITEEELNKILSENEIIIIDSKGNETVIPKGTFEV